MQTANNKAHGLRIIADAVNEPEYEEWLKQEDRFWDILKAAEREAENGKYFVVVPCPPLMSAYMMDRFTTDLIALGFEVDTASEGYIFLQWIKAS